MKFKTNIIHKAQATEDGVYYRCNHAVGVLDKEQLIHKTNWRKHNKVTCKNCLKRQGGSN